jgi:dTDP-glucose 4,6-dehydratase
VVSASSRFISSSKDRTDRLGHHRRYAIDSSFAQRELKWKPLHNFKEGLDSTIDWYAANRVWWGPLLERTDRH